MPSPYHSSLPHTHHPAPTRPLPSNFPPPLCFPVISAADATCATRGTSPRPTPASRPTPPPDTRAAFTARAGARAAAPHTVPAASTTLRAPLSARSPQRTSPLSALTNGPCTPHTLVRVPQVQRAHDGLAYVRGLRVHAPRARGEEGEGEAHAASRPVLLTSPRIPTRLSLSLPSPVTLLTAHCSHAFAPSARCST